MQAESMEFSNNGYSQLVISDAAATCMMETVGHSKIGKIYIKQDTIRQLFGNEELTFTTSSIGQMLPLFEERIGGDKPLELKIGFEDPQVMFGDYDTDLVFTFNLKYKFFIDLPQDSLPEGMRKELFYDDVRMVLAANIESDDDVFYMNFQSLKLDTSKETTMKKVPIRNSLDLTENEYREYLSTFGFSLNYLKKYLNDVVFRNGVKFPFNAEELYTSLEFAKGQMHVLIDVNEKAAVFFEEELWDENKQKEITE